MPYIADISDSLFRGELDSPLDISIPSIAAWLRFDKNVGELNTLINTTYQIDPIKFEIVDQNGALIGGMETAIYSQLYLISYYTRQSRKFLGVGGVDIVQEVNSDGGKVSFVNRNQLAKNYIDLRKDCKETLNRMVNWYKRNAYKPSGIDGSDINPFNRNYSAPSYRNTDAPNI